MTSPCLNSRPRQNGRYNTDDIFKYIFLNENVWFPTENSLKFVPKGPINNIQALVLIMACRRPGNKPLSEPMMVSLPTHICVTRPQWVNWHCLVPETIPRLLQQIFQYFAELVNNSQVHHFKIPRYLCLIYDAYSYLRYAYLLSTSKGTDLNMKQIRWIW